MQTTKYYEEFKRYYALAEDQQGKTNLGWQDYEGSTEDDLMNNVQLYDVVERKLAGFSQIMNDAFMENQKNILTMIRFRPVIVLNNVHICLTSGKVDKVFMG